MLDYLTSIITSLKYGHILQVQTHSIVILNQYLFIWNVLPQFTGTPISKHKFIKEMNSIGFQIVGSHEVANDSERNTHKSIEFRGPRLCLKKLEDLQGIRQNRKQQIVLLKQKIDEIKAGLEVKNTEERKQKGYFQLLDVISSLKSINRNIFTLNSKQEEIKLSYKMEYQSLKDQNKQDFIEPNTKYVHKKGKKMKTVKFYSSTYMQAI